MGGVEKLQPAELLERDVAARQFDLQRTAVVCGAEQDGLLLEIETLFAIGENLIGHIMRLIRFVANGHQIRTLSGDAVGPEVLGEAFARLFDHGIRGVQDRLARAVILVEGDDRSGGFELGRKVENVADGRRSERIDRLGVVADHRHPVALRFEAEQDRALEAVGILVLVDHDVIEETAEFIRQRWVGHGLRPVEQEIVVIEDVLGLLGLHIGRKKRLEIAFETHAPGKEPLHHLFNGRLGVDDPGIDSKTGTFLRETVMGF